MSKTDPETRESTVGEVGRQLVEQDDEAFAEKVAAHELPDETVVEVQVDGNEIQAVTYPSELITD